MTSFKGMIYHKNKVQLTPGIAELLPGLGPVSGGKGLTAGGPAPPIPVYTAPGCFCTTQAPLTQASKNLIDVSRTPLIFSNIRHLKSPSSISYFCN